MDKIKRLASTSKLFYYIACVAFWIRARWISFSFLIAGLKKIDNNKIVCCNTQGKNYGDNPKYIIDLLRKEYPGKYDIVWLLRKEFTGELPEGIRRVDFGGWKMIKELATAKLWIDSNTKPYGTRRKKTQTYIQTWHGSYGVKKLYYDREETMTYIDKKNVDCNSKIETLFTSNSRAYSEIFKRSMKYNGEILECGSPRNDLFFDETNEISKQVKAYFGISEDTHLLLYAPTFREDFAIDALNLDYDKVLKALENKFGGEWKALVRLHPQNMKLADSFIEYNENVINASKYSVMQELLVTCDLLITDYSSCMLDFVTTGKICFLFATDIEKYHADRGFYYDLYELPFPIAADNDELVNVIACFDEDNYKKNLDDLFDSVGLMENGTACKQVVEYINKKMNS